MFIEPSTGWATTTRPAARFIGQEFVDFLGYSVAIGGKTILVGAKNATGGSVTLAGAAYVLDIEGCAGSYSA